MKQGSRAAVPLPARPVPSSLISPALLRRWPLPAPDATVGKDGRGTVLVVGGSREIPGSVILAATAALRAGAGKLQIATGRAVAPGVALAVPEARVIGLRQLGGRGELHARSSRALLADLKQCDAVLIGPGMTATAAAVDLLRTCMTARVRPAVIIDAGALTAFNGRNRFARRGPVPVIATPHAGEMASLWGISREAVLAAPLEVATRAAAHLGVIVVLKGVRTHVASPDGRVFHNTAGNWGLATSGSGDTLSGIIAGLCARGADPLHAALWGVFLHARAGDTLARKLAPLGFLARELPGEIPPLMSRLARRSSQPRS